MRIAVFNTFDITPGENGGEIRLKNLYSRLSKTHEVRFLSYDLRCKAPVRRETLSPALQIVDTAVTDEDRWAFYQANERLGLYPHDVLCVDTYEFSGKFLHEIDKALSWAEVVVVVHPFLAPEIFSRCSTLHLKIFEALNVELRAKTAFFQPARDRQLAERLLEATRRSEDYALQSADIVLTVGEGDSQGFVEDYDVDASKLRVVPNGVTVADYDAISGVAIENFRDEAGVAGQDVGIFLGSAYGPNVDSYKLARKWLDDSGFTGHVFIVGRIIDVYDESWPAVGFTEHWLGFVDDATKHLLVASSDFALQIVTSGGGTNLKLFDYMASGVPILANEFGRRGVAEGGWFISIETPEDMRRAIASRIWHDPVASEAARVARAIALRDFDWDSIANTYRTILA